MAKKSAKNAKVPTAKKSAKNAKTIPAKKSDKTKSPSGQTTGNNGKRANSKNPSDPKRVKTTSASEIRPLTTADIPDIVAAVVGANQREMSAQVRTSPRLRGESNASRTSTTSEQSHHDPPTETSSDEEAEHEDFGEYITARTAYLHCCNGRRLCSIGVNMLHADGKTHLFYIKHVK